MIARKSLKRAWVLILCLFASAAVARADGIKLHLDSDRNGVHLGLLKSHDFSDAVGSTFLDGAGNPRSIEFKRLDFKSPELIFPGSLTLEAQSFMGLEIQIPIDLDRVWEKIE